MAGLKKLVPEEAKRLFHLAQSYVGEIKHGFAARKVKIIGVTGTSGKSTTSMMIYHLLQSNGYKVGLISTVGVRFDNMEFSAGLHVTTPDPAKLQNLIATLVNKGAEYIIVETSSHALAQGRVGLMPYHAAVFTNITSDHLDWHKTRDHYMKSKGRLIDRLIPGGLVVLNKDDSSYGFLAEKLGKVKKSLKTVTYSHQELSNEQGSIDGTRFSYNDTPVFLPVLGDYNTENALAAIKVAEHFGIALADAAKSFETFQGVPGRMQVMQTEPFLVIVDFAHNTDSQDRALLFAKKLLKPGKKLITLFGSAGHRDVEKRFTQGEGAGKIADITIATADDPRTESVYSINTRIVEGAQASGAILIQRFASHEEYEQFDIKKASLSTENNHILFAFDEDAVSNRLDAIDFAFKLANPGDIILAEGKGHEVSLTIGTIEYPYTDQEAVKIAQKNNLSDGWK